LTESAIYRIRKRAKERGYNSVTNFIFKNDFFSDAPRSGRPKEMDEEKEGMKLWSWEI
jgi:arabinogalactan endo-1,4-beta-galactosidase